MLTVNKHYWPPETNPPAPVHVKINLQTMQRTGRATTEVNMRITIHDDRHPDGTPLAVHPLAEKGVLQTPTTFRNNLPHICQWFIPNHNIPALACFTYADQDNANWTTTVRCESQTP